MITVIILRRDSSDSVEHSLVHIVLFCPSCLKRQLNSEMRIMILSSDPFSR